MMLFPMFVYIYVQVTQLNFDNFTIQIKVSFKTTKISVEIFSFSSLSYSYFSLYFF